MGRPGRPAGRGWQVSGCRRPLGLLKNSQRSSPAEIIHKLPPNDNHVAGKKKSCLDFNWSLKCTCRFAQLSCSSTNSGIFLIINFAALQQRQTSSAGVKKNVVDPRQLTPASGGIKSLEPDEALVKMCSRCQTWKHFPQCRKPRCSLRAKKKTCDRSYSENIVLFILAISEVKHLIYFHLYVKKHICQCFLYSHCQLL